MFSETLTTRSYLPSKLRTFSCYSFPSFAKNNTTNALQFINSRETRKAPYQKQHDHPWLARMGGGGGRSDGRIGVLFGHSLDEPATALFVLEASIGRGLVVGLYFNLYHFQCDLGLGDRHGRLRRDCGVGFGGQYWYGIRSWERDS